MIVRSIPRGVAVVATWIRDLYYFFSFWVFADSVILLDVTFRDIRLLGGYLVLIFLIMDVGEGDG